MEDTLIFIFAIFGTLVIYSIIFRKIEKRYNFLNSIKRKIHLNNKFKSVLFAIVVWSLIHMIITKLISTTTIFFSIIYGFLFGILLIFINNY